ncbi:hypothetical protein [Muricoccus aerilatus]|uniref:hypothetical protein n=1 Tax=Muricoccus aerilatus TaxID=452982 RepID=UPI00069410B5|nr:hypothetical protein [Roseomonas aerilata]
MYLTLRRYADAGPRVHEAAPRIEAGLVPILKRLPGFKGYCTFASEAGDGVSMTLFDSEGQATRANDEARTWVQSNLLDLLPDPPEVFAGPVAIQAGPEGGEPRFGDAGNQLYVLIRKFENISEPDKAEQFTREISIPAQSGSPGFRGFYAAWGDPARTRAAIVVLFDTRENADQSNERVIALIHEKGGSVVPHPTRVVAGRAVVIATAT